MGLIGGIARTAVVAGTATATANAVNRRQASKNAAAYNEAQAQYQQPQQQYQPPPQQYQPPPQQVQAQSEADDTLSQLERLSQLKAQGVLTEQEFQQQKAAILR